MPIGENIILIYILVPMPSPMVSCLSLAHVFQTLPPKFPPLQDDFALNLYCTSVTPNSSQKKSNRYETLFYIMQDGLTAMEIATQQGHTEVYQELYNMDVTVVYSVYHRTFLYSNILALANFPLIDIWSNKLHYFTLLCAMMAAL